MLTVGCHPSSWTFCCFSPVGQPKLIWHLLGGVGITPDAIMQKAFVHISTVLYWVMIALMIILHLCRKYAGPCACAIVWMIEINVRSIHSEIHLICFSTLVRSFEKAQEFDIETKGLWIETVWNRNIQFIDINYFPMSSEVSEQMHEQSGVREQSEQANEWAVQAIERKGRANGSVPSALIS